MKSGVTATLAKPTMLCAILAIACAAGGIASAQTFPNRPIRIVVGFAPAGPADVMARECGSPLLVPIPSAFQETQERGVKARGKTDRGEPIQRTGALPPRQQEHSIRDRSRC